MYSLIIWDFNGTVLDDVGIGMAAVNKLLLRRSLKTLDSKEDYYKVFGFPIIEYYKRLGFDFEKESYELLAKEWVREYSSLEHTAPLRPFVRELLEKISSLGIAQVILSASEKNMLVRQVELLGVGGYFDEILGMEDIYAFGKQEMAKRFMEQRHLERAVVLGDTEHDAEVAREIGADCILISGGHQSRETLEKCGFPVTDEENAAEFITAYLKEHGNG